MAENEKTQANALEPKQKVKGTIIKTTIGGAIVDLGEGQLPGVIHISQLQKNHLVEVEEAVKVGDKIEDMWVRRVKKDRIELTMIEPLTLEWREMKPDMAVKGKVERLESYGAFVDIGAERPGLVHVSEIAHGYIKDPSQIVKVGDEVDVMVLEINRRKKQIRLSMKATLPAPAESANRSSRGRGGQRRSSKKSVEAMMAELEGDEPKAPEHTAMEMAWQAALDRADSSKKEAKKEDKKVEKEDSQNEILSRTLKERK
ncbi:MAG: S1 RNA-binding domain-containing protein [Anaerolineae bacterium]|jgi:small subunit ribosomal protein S1|nr:S1 RNA-binding domain-containing protein [Anaerolineae bacterium]MBT7073471.1 S1 RNA-binding domain-containing protein [Anaerolineae bacterium]MBT7781476.1 S1 RNA-binding domain-containing protein [Anaerolineae bacterium]